jgi:predicted RNA-binding protein with PUA-like domain
VAARERFAEPVTLERLKGTKGLEEMLVVRRGQRLSIQPVTAEEWKIIRKLGKLAPV